MQKFTAAFAILPFFVIFFSLSFFTWTALSLGSALTFIAAFFPQVMPGQAANPRGGKAKIVLGPISVDFNGTLRFGMVVAGIILIISGVNQGGKDVGPALAKAQEKMEFEQNNAPSSDALNAPSSETDDK